MDIYAFKVITIDGVEQSLADYLGQVMLIVNVASRCGFTPQYAGLENLYRKYKERGLTLLGFPCDQFGRQEPGNEVEIRNFCSLTYDVTFPLFAKINVNGADAHPLYSYLKAQQPGLLGSRSIKWNFTKFLINRGGKVIRRYAPTDTPEEIEKDIVKLLNESVP